MSTPFLDWMKQAIPEAEIEGNVVRIPSSRFTYECTSCGGVFLSDWSDEDAAAEFKAKTGADPVPAAGYVCDVCYFDIIAEKNN
jgi:hypothetical protein